MLSNPQLPKIAVAASTAVTVAAAGMYTYSDVEKDKKKPDADNKALPLAQFWKAQNMNTWYKK